MIERIQEVIKSNIDLKVTLLANGNLHRTISQVVNQCVLAIRNDHKIWFCGNGGSAADAQHLAAELSGRFYHDRDPYFAEALHVNTSYLTAVANDYSYDQVYSRLIKAKGRKGDVFFGMSTSGNSKNVVEAIKQAAVQGVITVGMTGQSGGVLKDVSQFCMCMPSDDTPRIQEAHMLVGHIICELTEREMMK